MNFSLGVAKVTPIRDVMIAETLACKFALEAIEVHGIFED
jgi:hypothetical protein